MKKNNSKNDLNPELSNIQFLNKNLGFRVNFNLMSKMNNLCVIIILLFLFAVPLTANDFYPLIVQPVHDDTYDFGSPIQVKFDVCLVHNFPASASEWHVDITIFNPIGQEVYKETIEGFDANGPACYPITTAPDFNPSEVGRYTLYIETSYDQEINSENDLLTLQFYVGIKDLALFSLGSPGPNAEFYENLDFPFIVFVQNNGTTAIGKDEYKIYVKIEDGFNSTIALLFFEHTPQIEPGTILQLSQYTNFLVGNFYSKLLHKYFTYSVIAEMEGDQKLSNNILKGTLKYIPRAIWPNEISYFNPINKSSSNLANNDFVEFIVTDKFRDPELYNLMVYDSIGHQIDSTTLDLFTVGETVDSFTVYSYEFSGDVLPDHGAISLSYDSLRFSDYFISWGGPVKAVDGLWKDSTSTDVGITPVAGNSISLSGHGTDFSSFTWEESTPTPGLINNSQLVPVEEQPTLPNQSKLEQNYPNPFNPTTTIRYSVSANPKNLSGATVTLKLFDVLGREVKTLLNKVQAAGNYEVSFDASDLTSGVYYYQIKAGEFIETQKMSLLK